MLFHHVCLPLKVVVLRKGIGYCIRGKEKGWGCVIAIIVEGGGLEASFGLGCGIIAL